MSALDGLEDVVREKIENEQWTFQKLSDHLEQLHPGKKGFGVRSLKRFCNLKNIHKTSRLNSQVLDRVVSGAVAKVRNLARFHDLKGLYLAISTDSN